MIVLDKSKSEIKRILLACCTCMRPQMLKAALLSLKNIVVPANVIVEVLVVDNDKEQSAKLVIDDLEDIGFKINYAVEPERGLASVRNKLLEVASKMDVSHLMMFDDDEILAEDTLMAHVRLLDKYDEDIVSSGICVNVFDERTPQYIKSNFIYKRKFSYSKKVGTIKKSCATDNLFMPMSIVKKHNLRFFSEFVFMGGEDISFTEQISNLGYKIIHNSDSFLYEPVTESRANIKYVLNRAYFAGFCGPHIRFKNEKNKFRKNMYLLKLLVVLLFNCLFFGVSIFCGFSVMLNSLTRISKTYGKIIGTISSKPLDFYRNIQGK